MTVTDNRPGLFRGMVFYLHVEGSNYVGRGNLQNRVTDEIIVSFNQNFKMKTILSVTKRISPGVKVLMSFCLICIFSLEGVK